MNGKFPNEVNQKEVNNRVSNFHEDDEEVEYVTKEVEKIIVERDTRGLLYAIGIGVLLFLIDYVKNHS
jgi:tetrahydromethanopterin S-methyltransferase subunit G